jgi:hypothetical protein
MSNTMNKPAGASNQYATTVYYVFAIPHPQLGTVSLKAVKEAREAPQGAIQWTGGSDMDVLGHLENLVASIATHKMPGIRAANLYAPHWGTWKEKTKLTDETGVVLLGKNGRPLVDFKAILPLADALTYAKTLGEYAKVTFRHQAKFNFQFVIEDKREVTHKPTGERKQAVVPVVF